MERILCVVSGTMVLGGTETLIMNYYRHFDKSRIQIDFLCYGSKKGFYEEEIGLLGGKIYKLPSKRENIWKNLTGLYRICKQGHYKIIHVHMDAMSFYPLLIAKLAGVEHRICHCHSTKHLYNNCLHLWFKEILRICIPFVATDFFACSRAAGDWLYKKNTYTVINNAIDLKKFRYNPVMGQKMRDKFGFGTKKIIGNIGNLNYPKNQDFLIRLFKCYHEKNQETLLVLIGDGIDRKKLQHLVESLNIVAYVRFLGQRDDVCEIIQAFDIFLMTSFFEGFPVVAVEAQAAGVPCVLSDSITKECKITSSVEFCSLHEPMGKWEEIINDQMKCKKMDQEKRMKDAGYDIESESKKLEEYYLEKLRR